MKTPLFVLIAAALFGCSAPYECHGDLDALQADNVEADELKGSVTLAGDDGESVKLRATLRDLPKLWQGSGNIASGTTYFRFGLEYTGEPKGGDGKTEMPRVAGTLSVWGSLDKTEIMTSPFQAGEVGNHLDIFRTCSSAEERYCCPYGADSCSLLLDLRLERVDAAPFPEVKVDWRAETSAQITPCPLESEVRAALTFEQEGS